MSLSSIQPLSRFFLLLSLGELFFHAHCQQSSCRSSSSHEELKTWTPDEHKNAQQPPSSSTQSPAPKEQTNSLSPLIAITWGQKCAICHGLYGRGDTPQGRIMGAAVLTDKNWQEKTSDKSIKETIRHGKGKMPPFDLPDHVVEELVQHIRSLPQ
ncbi:c-type cytochrome [Pajaroellobacter abortibovis]|uniref:Cytochrome c domain-containing protein n=1 Tax=Pajaroellobacter abortibovis TaxID=1882918 RepID=A0A1L6MXJ1_9BACT|nr:cytochrome c [Pajaroellobacter abortibovis]APS00186.1 hypothetical protein BCY86_05455 [Pajaroellobacter abortibovis]